MKISINHEFEVLKDPENRLWLVIMNDGEIEWAVRVLHTVLLKD